MVIRECPWCGQDMQENDERCPKCGMKATSAQSEPAVLPALVKGRRYIERTEEFSTDMSGSLVIGIDPGARYTGIVIRDNDTVVLASTLVRPKEMQPLPWALSVVNQVKEIMADYQNLNIAIEGISDPKGFAGGKRAPLNPGPIMRTAAVAGACYATFPQAVIIAPGGNGTQHASQYPDTLKGRRPANLAGSSNNAGTRRHEQSAYDVAGKGAVEFARLAHENLSD